MTAAEYVALQSRRAEAVGIWSDWLAEHRIDAIVEPTLPNVARVRGRATKGRSRTSTTSR